MAHVGGVPIEKLNEQNPFGSAPPPVTALVPPRAPAPAPAPAPRPAPAPAAAAAGPAAGGGGGGGGGGGQTLPPGGAPPVLYGPPLSADVYCGDACPLPLPRASACGSGNLVAATPAVATLRGESPIFRDIECYYRSPLGVRLMGAVSASTYAVAFTPAMFAAPAAGADAAPAPAAVAAGLLPASLRHLHASFFVAPVGLIRRIEKGTPRGKEAGSLFTVDIAFKDVRAWTLVFRDEVRAAGRRRGARRALLLPPATPARARALSLATLFPMTGHVRKGVWAPEDGGVSVQGRVFARV